MCPLWGLGQGPEGAPKPPTPLVHLRPGASWGTRSGGARGSPPPPCTRLLADHKRKGKRTREARPGAVTGSYLRAPVGPDTAREGRFPFPTRLLWDAPPSCGPQPSRDTARTAQYLRSAASGNLYPAMAGRFTAAQTARTRGRGCFHPRQDTLAGAGREESGGNSATGLGP